MAKGNSRLNAGKTRRKSSESGDDEHGRRRDQGRQSGADNASQDDVGTPRPNDSLDQQPPAIQAAASPAGPSPAISSSTTSKKTTKRVAKNARPIAQKSESYYEKGASEPAGMTKEEDDHCLTCLRYSKRCKGTKLVMVNGTKRCECCANPGTGTSSRRCFWRNPGIETYEDAQRILGGRVLTENTRLGRLKRQGEVAEDVAEESSDVEDLKQEEDVEDQAKEDAADDNGEYREEESEKDDQDDPVDDDLQNAAGSAYTSLRQMIAQDLDLLFVGGNYTMAALAVERGLRDALSGSGPHQEHLEGITSEVLELIQAMVNSNIADMEGGPGHN